MNAVVVAALRTPIGRAHPEAGVYRHVRADDLLAGLLRELVARAGVPPGAVEDVVVGCNTPQGEQGGNLARRAALLAGLPPSAAAVTVSRACGSSLQAVNQAAAAILAGAEGVQIAAGVEHMHHLPPHRPGNLLDDPTLNPRLYRGHPPAAWHMGLTAELLARLHGIGRAEQDAYALRSHRLAAAADFTAEVVPTPGHDAAGLPMTVVADQGIRADASAAGLAALPPAFVDAGTVTAGNSSPLSVGAAGLIVASDTSAAEFGLPVLGRVRAWAVAGVDPALMGLGPVPAVRKALARAGLTVADIDGWEVNEAFAVQVLAVARELAIPEARLNVSGGAIALGHPLGASGARLAGTLLHGLRRRGGRFGVAALCVGGGQGIATVFEAT
jgi:acetyl-CoA acyltransferase